MNMLKEVRMQMHISQEQLGEYLGFSRAYVGSTEREERNLPTYSWVKLIKLYKLILDAPAESTPLPDQPVCACIPGDEREPITTHIHHCTGVLARLRKQYVHMKATCLQYHRMRRIINLLMNDLPGGREGQKDKIWLELLEMEVAEQLELNNTARQTVLFLKIEALKYELAMANALLQPTG